MDTTKDDSTITIMEEAMVKGHTTMEGHRNRLEIFRTGSYAATVASLDISNVCAENCKERSILVKGEVKIISSNSLNNGSNSNISRETSKGDRQLEIKRAAVDQHHNPNKYKITGRCRTQ